MAHNLRYHLFVLISFLNFKNLYSSSALASLIINSPMYSSFSANPAASTVKELHPSSCHPSDRDALLEVAASSSSSSERFSNRHLQWRHQQDCCHWAGVTCGFPLMKSTNNSSANSKLYSRVVGLELPGNFSDYYSDATEKYFGMLLPLAICRLSALASLDLSQNVLMGPIPTCFSHNLTSLQTLILRMNDLSGSLSPLANLSLLTHLDLFDNNFSSVASSIIQLSGSLTYLDLSGNGLSGALSALKFHTPMRSLKHLDLSFNSFSGSGLASFLKALSAYDLRYLDLSFNQLHISLTPAAFSTTPLLGSLNLSGGTEQTVTGDILVLENLPRLQTLVLNYLPIILAQGALESLLCKLGSLQYLSAVAAMFSSDGEGDLYLLDSPAQLDDKLPCEKPAASLNLTYLDLSGYTGPFPTWIGHFARLQSLIMMDNRFEGSIPQEWQTLTQLTHLYLSGDSPPTPVSLSQEVQSWLFRLPLEWLRLQSMGLTSEDFTCISGFSLLNHTLQSLYLRDNHISLGSNSLLHCLQHHNFSLLSRLDLSRNPLASPLQPHMFPMSIVSSLDLRHCQLFGSLPNRGTLPPASEFILAHNNLTGSIPWDIGSASFCYLDLAYNKLTGTIPSSVWNFTGCDYQSVIVLLDNNHLHGALAPSAGLIAYQVSLANNHLTKASFYNVSRLDALILSGNQLEGDLEHLLGDYSVMKYLIFFELDNNQLTASGSMISSSAIWNLTTASTWLSLNNNNLHGELVLHDQALTTAGVSIANNHLRKVRFHNVSYLAFLDLSSNLLGGTFESMLGDYSVMKNLAILLLRSNQLTGSIPSLLGTSSPFLITMDLSNNKLLGVIPPNLQHLQALQSKTVRIHIGYDFQYTLEGVKNVELNMTLQSPRGLLDLSSNQLSGFVPDSLGALVGLNDVNLSRNQLSGPIPTNLSHLASLESLDLSSNNLEGAIPSEFSKLTFLEVFDVSFNPELSGQIPEGPQFETIRSYQGDPKLCGIAISKKCGEQQLIGALTPTHQDPNTLQSLSFKERFESFIEEWIAIPGIVVGHVIGTAITIWALKRLHFYE